MRHLASFARRTCALLAARTRTPVGHSSECNTVPFDCVVNANTAFGYLKVLARGIHSGFGPVRLRSPNRPQSRKTRGKRFSLVRDGSLTTPRRAGYRSGQYPVLSQ
jgi:hypothetical protein